MPKRKKFGMETEELPPKPKRKEITFGSPEKYAESFNKATGKTAFTLAVPMGREKGGLRVQDYNVAYKDGKLVRSTPTGSALIPEERYREVDKRRRDKNPGFTYGDTRLIKMAKKKQVQSFDPFLRDKEGRAIGTALPPTGSFAEEPAKATTPPPTKVDPSTEPQIFRDPKTGKVSGVELPGGRTFLGIGPEEVEKILEGERRKKEQFGALEFGELTQEEALGRRQAEILKREAARRGVAPEELSMEDLPPEQLPAQESKVLQDISAAYAYVDSLGGLIPEEAQRELKQGTLPIGPGAGIAGIKATKNLLGASKAATGARATKAWTGMLTFLKSKMAVKLGGYGIVGYTYFTEKSLSSIDSALSQVRESLTLPVQLATANPNEIPAAWDKLTEFEEDIAEYESMVKLREPFTPSAIFGGRTLPIYQRIKKLNLALKVARNQLAKIEALNRPLTDEESALMLAEINKVLDEMEDPSKFLGII